MDEIFIKCYQMGFKGFYIHEIDIILEKYLDNICDLSIDKSRKKGLILYSLKRDKRNLYCIDILLLEDVLLFGTVKNKI